MSASPVIDVDGLTVTYGEFAAVRDLSFEVHRRATSGTVLIFGASPQDAWAFHVGVDRALGFGLKLPDSSTNTHLGRIGGRGARGDE